IIMFLLDNQSSTTLASASHAFSMHPFSIVFALLSMPKKRAATILFCSFVSMF
ncbi:hypothetical protein ACJX0J_033251, partial [Zea mays]